ncbi:blastula protease 10-like [Bradysia coprophila]|uniref:blastula protease 10-like n=1 Tax=Bradysia coprophila TaxID=38358 RepID=UPI00187D7D4D|nr:blastula protease 10-like [Bradysia coprophila]XP_037042823.1 blastula protease 10-like [Bradysia coprophila]
MSKLVILLAIIGLALGSPISKSKHVENTPENLALINSGNYNENIELLSGQYQGDMVLSEQQQRVLKSMERTGLIDVNMRWPNNVVPYVLSDVFSDEQKSYIEAGLAELARVSCLTFTPRTDEENYVRVNGQDGGCWSEVGFLNSGEQEVNLALAEPGVGCFRIGTIIHEFLHTLGFYHMQSATERDDYVKIAWENILPGLEHNFDSYPADMISNFGVDYDVLSVMHYPAYGFTRNGYATIIPHDITLIRTMGQRTGMSDKDVSRLNSMYQCN